MKRNLLRKLFFSTTLWFFAFVVAFAQAPAADLDSITEDSYQRMLERQAAEQESDTLLTSHSEPVLTKLESNEREYFYFLIGVFVIVGVVLVYWYIRRTSITRQEYKKSP